MTKKKMKVLGRGVFAGVGYIVREGESHFDGATRAAKKRWGKRAYLVQGHSNCFSGPWEVAVCEFVKECNASTVHYRTWETKDFFTTLNSEEEA